MLEVGAGTRQAASGAGLGAIKHAAGMFILGLSMELGAIPNSSAPGASAKIQPRIVQQGRPFVWGKPGAPTDRQ